MCAAIAELISPLCSPDQGQLLDLHSVQTFIAIKQLGDLPISYEDGGGLFPEPDWSRPYRSVPVAFRDLRRQWVQLLLRNGLINNMKAFFTSGDTQPPFTDEELLHFKQSLTEFIQSRGMLPDWPTREDQPMHLSVYQSWQRCHASWATTILLAA